jgi:hypothetical protein
MSTLPLQWFIDVHSVHAPLNLSYEANWQEREALKRYAEAEDVTSFASQLRVSPLSRGKFKVTGTLKADAVQASVVDLSPVPAAIEESFSVEFWPQELIEERTEGAVALEDDPPEPIVGGRIAIGEFLCELFSVSLDPYPRNADDTFSWEPAAKEPPVTPFAELARLRQKKPEGG